MVTATAACSLVLLLLAIASSSFSFSLNITYIIRPNGSPCPGPAAPHANCLTLEEFATRESVDNTDACITLDFMIGTHYLSHGVEVMHIQSFSMRPLTSDGNVRVVCTNPVGFFLHDIATVAINKIGFSSCTSQLSPNTITVTSIKLAEFTDIMITNSTGSAIKTSMSFLILRSSVITHCGLINAMTLYTPFAGALLSENSKVLITGKSEFSENVAYYAGGAIYIASGTLEIDGAVTFANNRAVVRNAYGGAIFVDGAESVKVGGDVTFVNNTAGYGGGGLYVSNVLLQLSGNFVSNSAKLGGAAWISYSTAIISGIMTTSFLRNHASVLGGALYLQQSRVELIQGGLTLENNTATWSGGGLYSYKSSISFNGNVTFANNTAFDGGGCYLSGQSFFILGNDSNVLFVGNLARQTGGGLLIESSDQCRSNFFLKVTQCFFQVEVVNKYLHFRNNAAAVAGHVVYGGDVYDCLLRGNHLHPRYNFSDIVSLSKEGGVRSLSTIASNPYFVCHCENENVKCGRYAVIQAIVVPGQKFNVSVVTVGQANGVVPSSVLATLESSSRAVLGTLQINQETKTTCTNLTFQVYSRRSNEIISLSDATCSILKLHINVSLLQCPKGFELLGDPAECKCRQRLQKFTNNCTIDDQNIHRSIDFWVGYDKASRGLILHPHCPFHYCTPPPNSFTIEHSDKQCSYNRTGLLCGRCQDGLSLTLGTSRCLQCSNYYLALLAAFAIAGLTLVILLFGCRLTVAAGTVNALIFYANIVHDNRTLFFPPGSTNILTVFIDWLNLDLGIESCFYKGMDTYAQTWLQFVFPIYLWLLCGCIVIISRKSKCMSRVMGTNPVAVLATLFLLSYTKFLRTAMAALSFTTLSYPHDHYEVVWLYDANIRYLHGKHIPLFVVGLTTLLLCLPYTLLLLTNQWLQARSNLRLLRWVNSPRVMFFLDAYNAPFKPKFRYWTGLLLLARIILMIVSATNVLGDPSINLLAACLTTAIVGLWMGLFQSPYKSKILNTLEVTFILNVTVSFISTLYIRQAQGSQAALAYSSTALSLAIFAAIILSHGYIQLTETNAWKIFAKRNARPNHLLNRECGGEHIGAETAAEKCVTYSEIVVPRPAFSGSGVFTVPHRAIASQPLGAETHARMVQHNYAQHADSREDGTSQLNANWNHFSPPNNTELREPLLSDEST